MEKFPVLKNELARLEKLYSYNILDMEQEDRFDDLTKLAASILDIPICLITVIDANWQVFISKIGTDTKGNQRALSFCKYCVIQEEILEVEDTTQDERFAQNSLVLSPKNLRYYIGTLLIDSEGFIIGTVCAYDIKPRKMSNIQIVSLKQIASTIIQLIELRKVNLEQIRYKFELEKTAKLKDQFLSDMSHEIRTPLASIVGFNELLLSSKLSNDQQSYSKTVKVAAERLTHVINEVLVFDTHKIASEDVHPILNEEIDLSVKNPISNKKCTLSIPSLNGLMVLVAEDNKHLQILCKTFIERNEGEVYIVSNGQEAIEYLAKNEVDVVLLDMQMPFINGIQAAKHIRDELKLNCPIIGCSANLLEIDYTPEDLQYLDEFITKPYTEQRLITEIIHQFESKASAMAKDDFKTILNVLREKEGDELVNEFERIFRSRIPQDINDLIRAREVQNFREIQRKAHYLTTTLLTLKFSHGLALAEELEEAVANNQEASILILTDRFIDYLNNALNWI
jgi:CheY-like chemotaxis protein